VRFTIERIRTLVLVCGVLLIVALGVFLAIGRFKSPFSRRDIPKRLGIDIEQEANGVTYTQAHGGHTLFKIHASKVVQLKNDHALLHDVRIELYGADGNRVDRIEGDEFEYDQKAGTATAAGPVAITLMRPAARGNPSAPAAKTTPNDEIHVKTSGLTFNQKSGVVTTAQRVDFVSDQGSGASMGASYDSQRGFLVLDRDVELNTFSSVAGGPGAASRHGDPVEIHAAHAEFERDTNACNLRGASAESRGRHAQAAEAEILFRNDGSAIRLDATGGLTVAMATGGRLAAPTGTLEFDEHNRPRHGHLAGGVKMDSVTADRTVHGTAPTLELTFTARGDLRHAHLERGVEMRSEETSAPAQAQSAPLRTTHTWRSPVADVDFRDGGNGQVEPSMMQGTGGVVLTGLSQRGNGAAQPSRLAADTVSGEFGPNSALTAITGSGNASMEQTTPSGARETAAGDRLSAHFVPGAAGGVGSAPNGAKDEGLKKGTPRAEVSHGPGAAEVQSAVLDGHVVLMEQPAPKAGAPQPEMRATADHADYESAGSGSATGQNAPAGDWLHLAGNPRVEDGGLQMTADRIDVDRLSGDAFAHGNVKGTWLNAAAGRPGVAAGKLAAGGIALGGQGPAHVIAAEAELRQATGEATFRGNARLWQEANSVTGNVILLDRQKQTLTAHASNLANPVTAVLVSAGKPAAAGGKTAAPSVIRVRGGDLWYSDAERRAVMRGGIAGAVTAETGAATTVSQQVELQLTPADHRGNGQAATGQVERMTATGRVTVSSQGRRGAGEQLVYTGADGRYVLTGTAAVPPKMTDPERGSVTGEALIFNSRDDSVSIEGGAHQTRTETTAPK
jgi:lipopolysaccharide export system protein LptA